MALYSFKGGIHPPEKKDSTENLKIENFPAPQYLYIPLLQHIGTVCDPIVNIGDRVLKGQKIAESSGKLSVPVHSSVSGIVKKIEILPFTLRGKVNTIVIENDFLEEEIKNEEIVNYKEKTKEELLDLIRDRGLVGLGGALFPSYVKLNPPSDKKIENLVINASECEPYLNSDNRLVIENSFEIIKGIEIALHILGIKEATIGIEDNKVEAIENLRNALKAYPNIKLAVLPTKYPQGGEKQLIKVIYNKVIPSGKLPIDIGFVVLNVTSAFWLYNSIVKGKVLIEEIVTVSGGGISAPKNYRVPIGTRIKEILDAVGFKKEITEKLLTGGPMMGISQYTDEVPVIKGTSGILALTKEETNPYKSKSCISCGKCVEVCPMGLSPLMYAKFAEFEKWEEFKEYNIFDCIECGSCQFICPAKRPLTEGIRVGKAKLRSMDIK